MHLQLLSRAFYFFRKSLGIASFFRGILLLYPEILVVVDSIRLRPDSKTNFASATFHNMLHRFKPYKYNEFEGTILKKFGYKPIQLDFFSFTAQFG